MARDHAASGRSAPISGWKRRSGPRAPTGAGRRGTIPNQFGTVDFARLCRLTGGKAYFAANLRSLPAQEFWRWAEQCNSPAGRRLRAADGKLTLDIFNRHADKVAMASVAQLVNCLQSLFLRMRTSFS
jgi:alpha-L-arabinofuranosidase